MPCLLADGRKLEGGVGVLEQSGYLCCTFFSILYFLNFLLLCCKVNSGMSFEGGSLFEPTLGGVSIGSIGFLLVYVVSRPTLGTDTIGTECVSRVGVLTVRENVGVDISWLGIFKYCSIVFLIVEGYFVLDQRLLKLVLLLLMVGWSK